MLVVDMMAMNELVQAEHRNKFHGQKVQTLHIHTHIYVNVWIYTLYKYVNTCHWA